MLPAHERVFLMLPYANSMNLRTEDYYFLSKALRKKFFYGEEEIRA